MTDPDHARIDPERPRQGNAFDQPDGYSGQDYARAREQADGDAARPPAFAGEQEADLPPDNGARASVDPTTGEVRGSGVGAGGGQGGEDLDSSSASGDSYQLTGGEGTDKTPGPLGPPPTAENATPLG